jgi:hypothetical protein
MQKRFPQLQQLYIAETHSREPMTASETLALVKMMNAALGGDVVGEIIH